VNATVEAGTASFAMELTSSPGGVRMRYLGVCDFGHRRLSARVDVATGPSGEGGHCIQVVDGGIVYLRNPDGSWHVADVGGWVAAGPLSVLGWLYGVEDVRAADDGAHLVTMSGRRAVDACPGPLREEMRHAFAETGQIDAVATGRVRLDDRNRVTEFRLDVPAGCRGVDGTVHDAARFDLVLSGFGEPALVEPPDAGPAVPVREYIDHVRWLVAESEQ